MNLDYIYRRRSLRKFLEKPVEKEAMETLLKAAMAAPSAHNTQPWEFIAITEPDVMDNVRAALEHGPYNAPAAIIVCGNLDKAQPGESRDYWMQDCSAAAQNILLAAPELGLGTCWIGIYPPQKNVVPIKKLFNLPEHVIPLGALYIGYPAREKEPRTQYNSDAVFWQGYGNK